MRRTLSARPTPSFSRPLLSSLTRSRPVTLTEGPCMKERRVGTLCKLERIVKQNGVLSRCCDRVCHIVSRFTLDISAGIGRAKVLAGGRKKKLAWALSNSHSGWRLLRATTLLEPLGTCRVQAYRRQKSHTNVSPCMEYAGNPRLKWAASRISSFDEQCVLADREIHSYPWVLRIMIRRTAQSRSQCEDDEEGLIILSQQVRDSSPPQLPQTSAPVRECLI